MLGMGREKSTEIDRLDNPIWGRAVDSEQSRMPANKVNIRGERFYLKLQTACLIIK